eukprot:scaffold17.g557.t1
MSGAGRGLHCLRCLLGSVAAAGHGSALAAAPARLQTPALALACLLAPHAPQSPPGWPLSLARGLATAAADPAEAAGAAAAPAATAAEAAVAATAPPPAAPRRRGRRKKAEPAAAAGAAAAAAAAAPGARLGLPARLLEDDAHPIRGAHLSSAAWFVLARLRGAGHECYVVGGTVRDILLGGMPKDYDILTSAEPHQVRKLFGRCIVVGKSFPVCHVHTNNTVIEVSSFSTNADPTAIPDDGSSHLLGRHKHEGGGGGRGGRGRAARGAGAEAGEAGGATWAAARRDNANRRDFTVNALLYDPFSRLLFDYVGATPDCEARLLRTIAPAAASFQARRIPRAVLPHRRRRDLLFDLLAALDEHATPQAPVDPSAWVALLAAPLVARAWQALMRRRQSAAARRGVGAAARGRGRRGPDAGAGQGAGQAPLAGVVRRRAAEWEGGEGQAGGGAAGGLSTSGSDSDSEPSGSSSDASDDSSSSSGSSSSDEEGEEGGEEEPDSALEAYAAVVEETIDGLMRPLDAELCGRLRLDGGRLLAARRLGGRGGAAAAAAAEPAPDELLGALLLGRDAPPGEADGEADGDVAVAAAAADAGEPPAAAATPARAAPQPSPRTVLLPCVLPKAALDKAAALLLAEAELRGKELPWERPPRHSARAREAGGGGERGERGERGRKHSRRGRKVSAEEKLVLSILRDPRSGFAKATDLAALRW